MSTAYRYYAAFICTDQQLGNALAALAAAYPGAGAEANTFTEKRTLSPQAWWAVIPCRENFRRICQAIIDDAPFTAPALGLLRSRGMTAQDWADAKAALKVETALRGDYSWEDFLAFLAANGYTVATQESDQ